MFFQEKNSWKTLKKNILKKKKEHFKRCIACVDS